MSDPARGPELWLRAGIVARAHGLDGSFYVAEPVSDLLAVGAPVWIGDRDWLIVRRAGYEARPILRLEGADDRAAADALRGEEIRVARERAPELGPDEWWARDLEGCAVRDADTEVGVVTRLLALPSCEVLEVARSAGGAELLVPLVKDAVRDVDLERRVIDVDLRFLGEA